MQEQTEQTQAAETADEAPETAGEPGAEAQADPQAAAVDQRAEELMGTNPDLDADHPAKRGQEAIARAEEHISSLDMEKEREAVDRLT